MRGEIEGGMGGTKYSSPCKHMQTIHGLRNHKMKWKVQSTSVNNGVVYCTLTLQRTEVGEVLHRLLNVILVPVEQPQGLRRRERKRKVSRVKSDLSYQARPSLSPPRKHSENYNVHNIQQFSSKNCQTIYSNLLSQTRCTHLFNVVSELLFSKTQVCIHWLQERNMSCKNLYKKRIHYVLVFP